MELFGRAMINLRDILIRNWKRGQVVEKYENVNLIRETYDIFGFNFRMRPGREALNRRYHELI